MFGKFYGGRPFNFWGGYGWFGKKCPADWFREDKSTQINSWWEKYPELRKISFMTDNAEKNLTPLYVGEKISNSREVWEKILPIQTKSVKSPIPHSPTNVQWSCQPFIGRRKKRIWHFSKCHPSTKWLARVHHVVVFKTKVLHFKIENTPTKDTNGRRNSTLFSTRRIGALGLFWTNKAARFLKTLEVQSVLYDQRKVRF